jgi:hypothetical protein
MKCKECGDVINLTVAGLPPNICWGCYENKVEITQLNLRKDTSSPLPFNSPSIYTSAPTPQLKYRVINGEKILMQLWRNIENGEEEWREVEIDDD